MEYAVFPNFGGRSCVISCCLCWSTRKLTVIHLGVLKRRFRGDRDQLDNCFESDDSGRRMKGRRHERLGMFAQKSVLCLMPWIGSLYLLAASQWFVQPYC